MLRLANELHRITARHRLLPAAATVTAAGSAAEGGDEELLLKAGLPNIYRMCGRERCVREGV